MEPPGLVLFLPPPLDEIQLMMIMMRVFSTTIGK